MGASLLAIAMVQPAIMLTDTPPSRASSLPQGRRCSEWNMGQTPAFMANFAAINAGPVVLRFNVTGGSE
ncbi:hypothetical protein FHK92_02930 [Pseudomonas brassicacearum subsp. neoaurantiaca]|uniref:Uncharacterized protein n=1 Tax=Pseudomonas brassicacearum subsp. neoaurantiaca TaxID=494916 RepID=A0A7V8RHU9_9PSED|nr:hypothetical protein [Pseudomonas brassicacearum subsp. neoaurantiaca]